MTRHLTLDEVLQLHDRVIEQSGGAVGLRDRGALESAVAQPGMTFDGQLLYPDIEQQASALAFSLIQNHPFVDGNKRIGHAAMETFLVLNGWELDAGVDEQEQIVLSVASGTMPRDELTKWIQSRLIRRSR